MHRRWLKSDSNKLPSQKGPIIGKKPPYEMSNQFRGGVS